MKRTRPASEKSHDPPPGDEAEAMRTLSGARLTWCGTAHPGPIYPAGATKILLLSDEFDGHYPEREMFAGALG